MPDDTPLSARAASSLAPRLLPETNWFVPEGERHIDGMALARMLAELLANAFLAAMMKEAATRSMNWLVARLAKLFDHATEPTPPDVADAAKAASAKLTALPTAERAGAMTAAHGELVAALSTMMPAPNAEKIAAAVQDAVVKHAA